MSKDYTEFMSQCPLSVQTFLCNAFSFWHHLIFKYKSPANVELCLKEGLLLSSILNQELLPNKLYDPKTSKAIFNFFALEMKNYPCSEENKKLAFKIFSYHIAEFTGDSKMEISQLTIALIVYNTLKDQEIRELIENLEVLNMLGSKYETILNNVEKFVKLSQETVPQTIVKSATHDKVLTEYGLWLTDQQYQFNPAIGRELELKKLKIDLLKSKSIILIGDAGVGKTAIIKGLAYDLRQKDVPNLLANKEIVKIDIHSLIAGAKYRGDFEERSKKVIAALKNNPNVIAYIEELHSIKGMGDPNNSTFDLMNMLKPYLSNGDIKIIGDTTIREYDTFLAQDAAFSRRFIVETIKEPSVNTLKKILMAKINEFAFRYQIAFDFSVSNKNLIVDALISLTDSQKHAYYSTRKNPDLVLDVLENIFAIAAYNNHDKVSYNDVFEGMHLTTDVSESLKNRTIIQLQNLLKINREMAKSRVLKLPVFNK